MADARVLLAAASRRLAAAGVPSPRVDAELLLAAVTGCPRNRLLTAAAPGGGDVARYWAAVARRAEREPLQHIVGSAPFRRVHVAVGPGVFVPRPETELLVDAVLPHLLGLTAPLVVDLCSGSGALAAALADELPAAEVVAVESSAAAVPWLERNVAGRPVTVVHGDVRDDALLAPYTGRADAVVANPPYIPATLTVELEVRADPPEAVFAGPDGLALLPAVVRRAAELLRPGGRLAVEHFDTHGDALRALLARDRRWADVADQDDLSGRPRYATARRVS